MPPQHRYLRNEDFWNDIIGQRVSAGMEIVLKHFQVMDWFLHVHPGLYYTPVPHGPETKRSSISTW